MSEQNDRLKALAGSIQTRLGRLKNRRSILEEQLEEISEIVLPIRGGFTSDRIKYERTGQKRFDSTAALANDELARNLSGLLTSESTPWFGIQTEDIELMNDRDVRIYLEAEEKAIFKDLASSNFYSQSDEMYNDLPSLGTGIMYRERLPGGKRFFKTLWLGECYLDENAEGMIDVNFRQFKMSARWANQVFKNSPLGLGKFVSDQLKHNPEEEITFIHAVYPRSDRVFMSKTKVNKKFASIYMVQSDNHILTESGFNGFPYYVPRWRKRVGDVYGFGPAIIALADIRMLNEMSRTILKAAQKVVEPPILQPYDTFLQPPNLKLNGINYFEPGTDDFMRPFPTNGNIPLGLDLEDRRREVILRAFHQDKLQLQKEKVEMTRAEAVIRDRENLRQMAPITSRIEREYLKPVIEDMIVERQRTGKAPPPPQRLVGQEVDIVFISPMARARKASEADAVFNTLNLARTLAEFDPAVTDRIDADKILLHSDEWFGLMNKFMRSDDEFAAKQQQRADQAQRNQMLEGVDVAAQAASALG